MTVIEQVLSSNRLDRPYNTTYALISAATDEISLNGVNFLLRREPDVLQKLLSTSLSSRTKAPYCNGNNKGMNQNNAKNNPASNSNISDDESSSGRTNVSKK
jgi:hypothetical protein